MPLPMKGIDNIRPKGRPPSCNCGQCTRCLTRARVAKWRKERYKTLEMDKDAVARELNITINLEELKNAMGKSGE